MLAAMKRAMLIRMETDDQGTLGAFTAEGLERGLHVLELPWRGNARNRSCIPTGRYRVVPHLSPRFRRCLLVTGVPGRSHILFHAGNFAGDAALGWRTHSHGCLLPGERRGRLLDNRKRRQRAVLASRTAMRRLLAWADAPFDLEIADA